MADTSLFVQVSADTKPLLAVLRAYEGEAQYAVAAAQRAAAAATVRDAKAEIANELGIPGRVLAKQMRPYSRKTASGWQAKAWLGHKAKLWPRQHDAIAAAAVRAGFKRAYMRGRLEYVRRDHLRPGSLEFFYVDLDTEANRQRLERAGRYHADVTYRTRLAREVDRRLARLGGGRKLARKEIGLYEARMRLFLQSEIQA